MRTVKRSFALVLALVLLVSTMALPAFAADATWQNRFAGFTTISSSNYHNYTGYVKAAQRFFLCYSATASIVSESGGVDGIFGDGTVRAVKAFQNIKGLVDDGIIGGNTWKAIASELTVSSYSSERIPYYIFRENGQDVIKVIYSASTYRYSYYNTSGGLGYTFHTQA